MRTIAIAALLSGVALSIRSSAGHAQMSDVAVGGGIGVTASARASGMGYHAAVNLPLKSLPTPWPERRPWDERPRVRPRPTVHLRGEVFYQAGTVTASPFHCDRVAQLYCFGRSDANQIGGAAAFVRIGFPSVGRLRFYFDPIGAGVYQRYTRSEELQGPTTLCIENDQVVSCADNPRWATVAYRSSRMSVGANTGVGTNVQVGALRMFAELRVHRLFESGESGAGAAPVTFGLVF